MSATVVLDSAMNYALAHNGISPLKRLVIENATGQPLTGMNIEIELTGPVAGRIAEPFRSSLPEVAGGESLVCRRPKGAMGLRSRDLRPARRGGHGIRARAIL